MAKKTERGRASQVACSMASVELANFKPDILS